MSMQEPTKQLASLGLTESETTIYLAMISGARTARDLVKATGLKRPTVYYALGCLEKRGLVGRTGKDGDGKIFLEPVEKLQSLAEDRLRESARIHYEIGSLIPYLISQTASIDQKPLVAFFEGQEAVKRTIMDMLYCKNKQIDSIVSKENFFWQVGKDFVERFVTERKRRGIHTKNMWDTVVDPTLINKFYPAPSEIRIVPPIMSGKFNTTIFMYDDKTLYVSSLKNSFCVLITSQEHHDTMHAWFDAIWTIAKPHKK
jgi:DNA-binding MarR family transcriptional regulator